MAISGALAAAGGSLYYLSGNTEFYWSTYQALPAEGFNGIAVALLATNNPEPEPPEPDDNEKGGEQA